MKTVKLNTLPLPTFESLGVNYVVRKVDTFDKEKISPSNGSIDITHDTSCTITAAQGESKSLIQYICSRASLQLDTYVKAENGTNITIIQVFDSEKPVISRLQADIADNASFELRQLYIGGRDTVSEIVSELYGRCAQFCADIAYTLDNADKIDLNLIANHYGKKSESKINVGGILKGKSDKLFKGTIDFKSGASGSKGTEVEDVLLLGQEVRSRTVPVILCSEEDVAGSHGATEGRMDDKKVFYLRSRGLSEEDIMRLMSKAKLSRVINGIGDEQAVRRIYDSLGWGETNE